MSRQELEGSSHKMADDEIDLVQLFQILLKRKFLILGVVFLCLLGGFGYVLLKDATYEYTTTLQIGTTFNGDKDAIKMSEIENPLSVKLKLKEVYIPAAGNQLSDGHDGKFYPVSVKEQKNSDIILIATKGGAEDEQLFYELHSMIVSPLIANHHEAITVLKKQYEILVEKDQLILKDLEDPKLFGLEEKSFQVEIESAQMQLAQFYDENLLLLAHQSGLGETKKLIDKQISHIERNLKFSYKKRSQAASEADDAANGMTFLMLNSDIQQNENELAALKERLYVELENEKQQLKSQLAGVQRGRKLQISKVEEAKNQLTKFQIQHSSELEQQRNTIAAAENKINLYQDTRTLDLAVRSLTPVGTGKTLILALAGMLGLMGGIIFAFFAEFMIKVRE